MFRPRRLLAAATLAVAVAGCGAVQRPLAGTIAPGASHEGRAQIDDPRLKHINCLRQHGIAVRRVGQTGMQIGAGTAGPYAQFEATPGAAQALQIDGKVEGAEVIGSALLYPHGASDAALKTIETCVALGVSG